MKVVRVGILGAGHMGIRHAGCLMKIQDVEIAAVCDSLAEKAEILKSSVNINNTQVYSDFDLMLKKEELDALYICLPPYAHNGQFETACGQGINIFIEKPVALDIGKAESMVEASRRSGIISQVGYHMRFGSAVTELKKLITDGTAGMPSLFNACYECNSLHAPWWIDRTKSGGQLFEQVIHLYDLAMFYLGDPVQIAGFMENLCHTGVPGYTVEDTSVSIVKFKSNAIASITGSNCAVPKEWNSRFTVICQNITAHFKDPDNAEFIYTAGDDKRTIYINGGTDMYLEENKAFIAAVRGENESPCDIEQGYMSLKLVDCVINSSECNKILNF